MTTKRGKKKVSRRGRRAPTRRAPLVVVKNVVNVGQQERVKAQLEAFNQQGQTLRSYNKFIANPPSFVSGNIAGQNQFNENASAQMLLQQIANQQVQMNQINQDLGYIVARQQQQEIPNPEDETQIINLNNRLSQLEEQQKETSRNFAMRMENVADATRIRRDARIDAERDIIGEYERPLLPQPPPPPPPAQPSPKTAISLGAVAEEIAMIARQRRGGSSIASARSTVAPSGGIPMSEEALQEVLPKRGGGSSIASAMSTVPGGFGMPEEPIADITTPPREGARSPLDPLQEEYLAAQQRYIQMEQSLQKMTPLKRGKGRPPTRRIGILQSQMESQIGRIREIESELIRKGEIKDDPAFVFRPMVEASERREETGLDPQRMP